METLKLDVVFETIGRTRSGKQVIRAINLDDVEKIVEYLKTTQRFTPDDLLDAYAVFAYLAVRAQRKNMTPTIFEDHVNVVFRRFEGDQFEQARLKAGIATAFDFQSHARSLVNLEFKEF